MARGWTPSVVPHPCRKKSIDSFTEPPIDRRRTNKDNDTFILNTGEEVTVENIKAILDRGDFFVARRIWNKSDGKCHDHFVFVKER